MGAWSNSDVAGAPTGVSERQKGERPLSWHIRNHWSFLLVLTKPEMAREWPEVIKGKALRI